MGGSTGFREGDPRKDHPAWPLYFSNLKQAWDKSKGDGIAIFHPDTGWAEHPDLIKGNRYHYQDERLSRNFRRDDGEGSGRDPMSRRPFTKASHGSSVASVMIGGFGVADADGEGNETGDGDGDDAARPPLLPDYDELEDAGFASGVAPLAHVLPQRVVNSVVLFGRDLPALARAINFATRMTNESSDWNVGVISISLGSPRSSAPHRRRTAFRDGRLFEALKYARQSGLIVCAAAGQLTRFLWLNRLFRVAYPGRSVHTICAAACDREHDMLASGFYGREVDITAPGVDINVTRSDNRLRPVDPSDPEPPGDEPPDVPRVRVEHTYKETYGSSYATAMLAGACALWLARYGRDTLIERYTKPLMLDAFKLAVWDTSDKRHDDADDADDERPCRPTLSGSPWNADRHGVGVLDVEALLAPDEEDLPSKSRVEACSMAIGWDD